MSTRSRLVAVAAVVLAMASPSPATAHTDLLSADPADGAVLRQPPSSLTLTFSEEMSPRLATITVRRGDGRPRALPVVAGAQPSVLVARVDDPAPSTVRTPWTVAYRVTSTDGHPVSGELRFVVAASSPTVAPDNAPLRAEPSQSPTESAADETAGTEERRAWGLVVPLGVVLLVLVLASVAMFGRMAREDR